VLPFNLSQVIIRGVGNSIYNTDQFVLTALHTCTALLNTFVGLYQELPAAAALFSHTKAALDRLDTTIYPESLQVYVAIYVFDMLTHMFNMLTRVFDMPTRMFDMLTRVFDMLTHVFDMLTHVFDMLMHVHVSNRILILGTNFEI